ncbi:MAG: Diguanylate cyclase domain protein [Roseomonas sp.]|nr:Diguanylate cyclase domain protein [Roseomonas sp.]
MRRSTAVGPRQPSPGSPASRLAGWATGHVARRRAFRLGLGTATALFVLSLGVSMLRVAAQYQTEAQMERGGLWTASRAQIEITRLIALLQRRAAGDPAVQAGAVEARFRALRGHVDLLENGQEPSRYAEMLRLRQRLPEIRQSLETAQALLPRLLAGEATLSAPVLATLEQVEETLLRANLQLHLERQAAGRDSLRGMHSLHWTLLACMVGLVVSAGLLIALLAAESRLARELLRGVKDASGRQRQAERTLRVLIDGLPAMVSAYDDQGRYLFFNEAHGRFHALGEEIAVIGRRPAELGVMVDEGLEQALRGQSGQSLAEHMAIDPDGRQYTLLATATPVHDEHGLPGLVVHVALDITDRKVAEDRVRHLAEHDALTDLPNRLLFARRLQQALVAVGARQDGGGFALHCIDLDRFKQVNDSLGHPGGDRLLQAATERMRACLRRDDTLARLGGDEFAIIQADVAGEEDVARLSARLVAVLALPFVIDGCTLHSGASIGSVMAPWHGHVAAGLQQRGDIALYRAKLEGRGRAVLFSPEMEAALVERRVLEIDLRLALEREELTLVYQPKFPTGSTRPNGCEALLRWRHPERGLISPAIFVPVAEEAGLASALSRLVLRQACAQIGAWQRQGLAIPVAVNLSALHFASNQAVTLVEEALATAGVPARLLEVEVTEGVFIRNAAAARAALSALRAQGVRVALDDFGTGYSSLSYLQHLPFDVVKVDRAFVRGLRQDDGSSARIVDAIVRLAHGLGAEVVAEGVERPEQLELLRQLGCDAVQGFLLGRPMPPEEMAALFAATLPPGLPLHRFASGRAAVSWVQDGAIGRKAASRT